MVPAHEVAERWRLLLWCYLNPFILTVGGLAYFTPFVVRIEGGSLGALMLVPFLFLALFSFLGSWCIALVQTVFAVQGFARGRPLWKHHAASAGWTFSCYGIWLLLISEGYMLTV